MARVGTLGDLAREQRVVTVYCSEIHSASWPGWFLAERFGADMLLQVFMDRCRCGQCGKRAVDLKLATFGYGMAHNLGRCSFQPPPALADPVRMIGALAVALFGPEPAA